MSEENLRRYRRRDFLPNLVTCDESWINYDGIEQKIFSRKRWKETPLVPRPNRHHRKQMLIVFWTVHDSLHWELLAIGANINSKVYCNQLGQINANYELWRQLGRFNLPLVFQDGNAPSHRS